MTIHWDKWGAQALISSGLLSRIERVEGRLENILRVLVYHRLGDPSCDRLAGDPSLFSATADGFAEQMQYLSENCHVVSPPELLYALDNCRPLPPRSVMITFDDGYHDFMDLAWPVLQKYQLPVILFVPTDYVTDHSQIFWWDRLFRAFMRTSCTELPLPPIGYWRWQNQTQRDEAMAAVKRQLKHMTHEQAMTVLDALVEALKVDTGGHSMMLSWQEVRQMSESGLYVGAHTASHPILSRVPREIARGEIVRSQQMVKSEIGHSWPIFCYPVGHQPDLRPDIVAVLEQEGFRAAVTMIEGHNIVGRTHPLRLRRVAVAPHLSLTEFRLVLTQAYNLYGTLTQIGPAAWK